MQYSYATVSLYDMTPERAVAEVSAAGFRGVEWKVGEAPHAMTSTAVGFLSGNLCTLPTNAAAVRRLARTCRDEGLTVVGLAPYLQVGDLEGMRAVLDLAGTMGAPQVRLQAPRPGAGPFDYHDLAAKTTDYLGAAQVLAADVGLRVAVELHHNTIAPSAELAHRLVSAFDPAVVGVIYDVGNLVWEGYVDHRLALQVLGAHLHHVHLKNVAAAPGARTGQPWRYVWSPLDVGLVDVPGVLALLQERGYEGWVSLEDLSNERDPRATMQHNATVLSAIPAAGWPSR